MKKILFVAIVALIGAITCVSCSKDEEYTSADVVGTWMEDTDGHYYFKMVFNSDGTGTQTEYDKDNYNQSTGDPDPFTYKVLSDSHIVIMFNDYTAYHIYILKNYLYDEEGVIYHKVSNN